MTVFEPTKLVVLIAIAAVLVPIVFAGRKFTSSITLVLGLGLLGFFNSPVNFVTAKALPVRPTTLGWALSMLGIYWGVYLVTRFFDRPPADVGTE